MDERFYRIKDTEYANTMIQLLDHTRKSREADESFAGLEAIGEVVRRSRSILENLNFHQTASLPADSREKLEVYYGNNWYKCPRHTCFYFHEGYPDAAQRNNHANRHEKPFCCTELSCPRIHLGFSSKTELDRHMTIQHPDPAAFAWRFPKIKQPAAKHRCTECPKEFTRAHSLNIHVKSHANDRNFGCRFCSKSFVRKYDRDRHEGKLHAEKKKQMGSASVTATASPVPSSDMSENAE
jgi:hypothetical protein